MAISKQTVTVLAATSVPAGTTLASPVSGASDVRTFAGGEWTYKISNGTGAPNLPATLVLQISHDGTNWYDYFTITGSAAANVVISGSVNLGRGVMYPRAIAYGNTTNSVTVESFIQAVVG